MENTEYSDAELWDRFHTQRLTHSEWTHMAHLRTAWMHLARWTLDEAHLRIRVGIIRLNAAQGLVETAERGYHETPTRTWLVLVNSLRTRDRDASLERADSLAFLAAHEVLRDRAWPLRYYSRERMMSLQARAIFVPPDIADLQG